MPKYIELLPCDWLISYLCYQAIEQVYLIKWPVSVVSCHRVSFKPETFDRFVFLAKNLEKNMYPSLIISPSYTVSIAYTI